MLKYYMALQQGEKKIPFLGKQRQLQAPSQDFLELNSRLRILEERHTNLNRKIEVIEANMLRIQKHTYTEIKAISSDIAEIRRQINELQERTAQIIRELKNFANRDDIEVLKKYIDMWEPMNFATKSDVQKTVKEMLEKR